MNRDGIILLHGIFRTHRSMNGLANFLRKHEFAVLNVGYPSTKQNLEAIAATVHPTIADFTQTITGKVHYVGYSMGGLVTRVYLNRFAPPALGKVVMMGTPNHGSEVADFIQNWLLYKKLYGPAGQQLTTNQPELKKLFGEVNYELGIIAGKSSIDPIGSYLIGKENDGKVSVESTKLEGMKAHTIMPVSHTFMPHSRKIWEQVLRFLKLGHF